MNLLSLLNPYILLGLLMTSLTSYGVGRWSQYQSDQKAQVAAILKAEQKAREKEQEWALIYKETTDAKEASLRVIADERDRALASLRNRPRDRVPGPTPTACLGSSPAALSESDASVVVGLAVEADQLRTEYLACRNYVEALTR